VKEGDSASASATANGRKKPSRQTSKIEEDATSITRSEVSGSTNNSSSPPEDKPRKAKKTNDSKMTLTSPNDKSKVTIYLTYCYCQFY